MFKWIAGVLASLLAGVGVWFVTEKVWPTEISPSIANLESQARLSKPSSDGARRLIGTFRVRNDGARTVENCQIRFENRSGPRFSLAPGQIYNEQISGARKYHPPTVAAVHAKLKCGDYLRSLTGRKVTINDSTSSTTGRPTAIDANAKATVAGTSN